MSGRFHCIAQDRRDPVLSHEGGSVTSLRMNGLDCIAALKALGEETRLRMLRLLFKEQLGVNAIAERLEVSQYNVSKHLRVLREAGLLEVEKQGQQRLYSVVNDLKAQVAANNNILDLGCCTFRLDKLPK
jgi:DNA-binding transcriptional ArsR family regulator